MYLVLTFLLNLRTENPPHNQGAKMQKTRLFTFTLKVDPSLPTPSEIHLLDAVDGGSRYVSPEISSIVPGNVQHLIVEEGIVLNAPVSGLSVLEMHCSCLPSRPRLYKAEVHVFGFDFNPDLMWRFHPDVRFQVHVTPKGITADVILKVPLNIWASYFQDGNLVLVFDERDYTDDVVHLLRFLSGTPALVL